jgi:carbon monoxide dehydrogenase subunit G
MDMTGEVQIAAPREKVWVALNDPEILRQSIPGCEQIAKISDTEMEAVASISLGPVKAKFKGKVLLSDLVPPQSYTLSGEGSGGAAGFAKGEAKVKLTAHGDATVLSYTVKASIGGKLAQMGQRLIDGAAKKMADDFFARFSALAAQQSAGPIPSGRPKPHPTAAEKAPAKDTSQIADPPLWMPLALIALCLLVLALTLVR